MDKIQLEHNLALKLLSGLSSDNPRDVDVAFGEAANDYEVRCLFQYLRKQGSAQRRLAKEFLYGVAPFYLDSDDKVMRLLAMAADRKVRKNCVKRKLLSATHGDLTGIELGSADGKRFAVFLPDASNAGQVRVQFFDRQGFSGHCTRKTYSLCLDEALNCGIQIQTQGNLDAFAVTPEFTKGNEIASRIASGYPA